MSYTPTNWSNGDSITAAKLNKMEQGIEDASSGGSCDCGYEYEESYTTIYQNANENFDDIVAPSYYFSDYIDPLVLGADIIRLTFDGTEYFLNKFNYYDSINTNTYIGYGAPFIWDQDTGDFIFDFSEYPVCVSMDISGTGSSFYTNISGATHSIKIENASIILGDIGLCFRAAVSEAYKPYIVTFSYSNGDGWTADRTYAEVIAAQKSGKMIVGVANVDDNKDIFTLSQVMVDHILFSSVFMHSSTAVTVHQFEIIDLGGVNFRSITLS